MPWFELLGFVVFGFFVGTYGSMVGVGGGFLVVPLLLALGFPARIAAGTSVIVVLANAASSTVTYLRQRRIDLQSGLIFSVAGIPGAIAGAWVDQHVPHRVFSLLFAALLILVAGRSLFARNEPLPDAQASEEAGPEEAGHSRDFVDAFGVHHQYRFNIWVGVGISIVTGFLASMFGIGGGVVQVPAMIYLLHFPTHVAVATSSLVIFVTALFGGAAHAHYGDVLLYPALFLSIGAVAGAQLGAQLSARMKPGPLMRWFSLIVVFAVLFLLLRGR